MDKRRECTECNKFFTGPAPYLLHLKSEKHIRKINQKNLEGKTLDSLESNPESSSVVKEGNTLRCEICDIQVTSPELMQMHLQGKKHRKTLHRNLMSQISADNAEDVDLKSGDNSTGFSPSEPLLKCEVCQCTVSGGSNLQTHYAGKRHKKALEKMGDEAKNLELVCRPCGILLFESQVFKELHNQTQDHKEKQKKYDLVESAKKKEEEERMARQHPEQQIENGDEVPQKRVKLEENGSSAS